MNLCLDFDGVLSERMMQNFVKKCMKGNEVWIVTARKDNEHCRKVMKPVLDKLGLSFASVIFCNGKPKKDILVGINADLYIDNETIELSDINEHTNTIALLWYNR
jgi:5'(3')-deoxyribonucleotidase